MGHIYIASELIFVSFLLLQFFPVLTAWRIQSLISFKNVYERLATTFFIYCFLIIVYTGLLGTCSVLSPIFAFILGTAGYAITWYATRNRKRFKCENQLILFHEKFLIVSSLCAISFLIYLKLELPELGTDALGYHLYIPASWIQTGHIYRLAFPECYVQYYSCYGEMMYAWWMLPSGTEALAKILPYVITIFIFFTIISTATTLGFKRITAIESATCTIFINTIVHNANVSNTDLFVGYFLLSGVFLYLHSLTRNSRWTVILSGLSFGLGFGTKLLGLLLAPTFCVILLAGTLISNKFSLKQFALWTISAIAAACPFHLSNWITTGNPIYPLPVKLFGINIFEGPINLGTHNRNSFAGAWNFFVNHDVYAINIWAGIVLSATLATAIVICIIHKQMHCRKRMYFWVQVLSLNIILSIILLIALYSKDGHPRQIIPVLLLFSIPLCSLFRVIPQKRILHAGIIILFLIANTGLMIVPELIIYSSALTIVVLLFLYFKHKFSSVMQLTVAVIILVVIGIIVNNQLKCCNTARNNLYKITLPANGQIAEIIAEENNSSPQLNIASVCMSSFLAMGPKLSNRVVYIPISQSGKLFPHEYSSPREMRTPGGYGAWKKRLLENNIDYLLIDFSTITQSTRECPELKWAFSHPNDFKPVGKAPQAIVFRFISRKQD